MRRVALVGLAMAGTAAAQPLPVSLPEQAPPPGPRTVRVQLDGSAATGIDGAVRSSALTIEAVGQRGGWFYGVQLGAVGWVDRYTVINTYTSASVQPTNPVLTAGYWGRLGATPIRLGLHVAAMPGITGGVACDCDGVWEHQKRPSQLTRFGALPTTVPDESAGLLGVGLRLDHRRYIAQAEAAIVGVLGNRGSDGDTPNHGWFAAGVGARVVPALAVTAHGFIHRGKRRYEPYEHRYAVGAAAHLEVPGATVSLRVDLRLDRCYLGEWLPDEPRGTCTRVVADYARAF
ncbi:MAG: hypothetical protein JNK64_39735 [Myxococcales bacterium]|nr:hypothetical protein [Myxococcales bacterium]